VSLPLAGLEVERGGAANRLVFFTHASRPDWKVFTSDGAILRHPELARDPRVAALSGGIRRRRMLAGAALGLVLAVPVLLLLGLFLARGWMVGKLAEQVPVAWEEGIGDAAFKQLGAARVVEDPEVLADFEKISGRLVAGIGSERYRFTFYIVEDSSLNAFALPGGTMAIHTGLLLAADSAEEVAGVMAHELAHVTAQHGVRNLIEMAGLYAVVTALFGDATGVMAVVANNAPVLLQMKFSRDHEREADAMGFGFLMASDIDPSGMITFFRKLQEEQGEASPPAILSTHPATTERIANLERLLATGAAGGKFSPIDLNYGEFKERLRERLNNNP
jgi:predicted Zn-dependent protease